jgi:hypothetical protein
MTAMYLRRRMEIKCHANGSTVRVPVTRIPIHEPGTVDSFRQSSVKATSSRGTSFEHHCTTSCSTLVLSSSQEERKKKERSCTIQKFQC